ncbi:MAG: hypothetical protein J6K71_01860 [Clostridia bacterium]|nr:hypothetical protein [Clostridia bacterium]
MAQKILLLSLSGTYGTIIGKIVAKELGQGFLNVDDQIAKMLSKLQPVPAKQGIKFVEKFEKHAISQCLESQAGVFCVSYGLFIHNRQFFQNCKKVYLRLAKEMLAGFDDDDVLAHQLAFIDHDKVLLQADFVVDAEVLSYEKTASEIIKKIRTNV